ncbi:MAG: helix-turn-helix domain-containing protein [Spirochaetaceae bacterium]|nr:helix-turn-helix domain-containing protein [Spirochaetaceae bacterium]
MCTFSDDLRVILAQNVKTARKTLRLTQSGLAENANISLSYVVDIERRRSWVSDKTLSSIACALNMEAYELLMPSEIRKIDDTAALLPGITALIEAKKIELKEHSDTVIDELARDVIKLFSKT